MIRLLLFMLVAPACALLEVVDAAIARARFERVLRAAAGDQS